MKGKAPASSPDAFPDSVSQHTASASRSLEGNPSGVPDDCRCCRGSGESVLLGAMNVRNAMALSVMVVGALLAYLRLHK
jgi:hypothetical protein